MKARVKATGRVIEVINVMSEDGKGIWEDMSDINTTPTQYHNYELDFIDLPKDLQYDEPDYWEKLHHQAAIAAMQGLISKEILDTPDSLSSHAIHYATTLVEKLKNETHFNK